jgi:hypothetical protein
MPGVPLDEAARGKRRLGRSPSIRRSAAITVSVSTAFVQLSGPIKQRLDDQQPGGVRP